MCTGMSMGSGSKNAYEYSDVYANEFEYAREYARAYKADAAECL